MDKLSLAHEMALAMQGREPIVDMKIIAALSFDYAEAMLAEEEKRRDKSTPVVFEVMESCDKDENKKPIGCGNCQG